MYLVCGALCTARKTWDSKLHMEQPQHLFSLYVDGITSTGWECDKLIGFMLEVAWPRFFIIG